MRITTILAFSGWLSVTYAQGVRGGTVNGKAIPDSVFTAPNVCDQLHGVIRSMAEEQAVRDMGITATPEDIAAVSRTVRQFDPVSESKRIIEHTTMMISALTAVDRGQDQHQVYTQMLQPKGVDEREWTSYLQQWKDPKGRAEIEQRLTLTPDVLGKMQATADHRPLVIKRKLDEAVDGELASKDPKFRTALDHWNTSAREAGGGIQHSIPTVERQYMNTQRDAWWRERVSKMNIVLNDPKLYQTCGLNTK